MDFKDLSEAIKVLENYKIDLMFNSELVDLDELTSDFAVHHFLAAIAQIEVAIQSLKLADVWAAREDGDRRAAAYRGGSES